MLKVLVFCFLLLQTLSTFGQIAKTISIDTGNACPLNLSEIAEKVVPIPLEDPDIIQNRNILMTSDFLFISSIRHIIQNDLSGKLIRRIDCRGYITDNVSYDPDKEELYVPVGDTIKCYDYSGQLIKKYPLKAESTHCLYHGGFLWIQSYSVQPDTSFVYAINKINLTTGEIITLPYEKKIEPFRSADGSSLGNASAFCRLTLYQNEVIASFDYENTIYKIEQDKDVFLYTDIESPSKTKQDKVIPLTKWEITPSAKGSDIYPLSANGFIGDYLFINYRRDDKFYIYLENMKTRRKYNANQIIDDIFHTDGNCAISSMSQEGYFVFIKGQDDIKGDSIGNVLLKGGPVVFIAKTK
jgi:hypothetical protein